MNHPLAKVFASECIQLVCRIEVFGEMRLLKLGIGSLAHVVFGKLTIGTHCTAKQPAAEGAVRERSDAAAESVGQNVGFYFAFKEIVRRLNCVQWRDGLEARHLFGRIVTHADGTNPPLFVESTKSGGCFLDGNEKIRPGHLVDTNAGRVEATE